tara:strand:- start:23997 stop:24464 length:468 start_codon:yes stop_codon:yes gene_type:complete
MRIGQGYDVHPFVDGRKLILGGVEIPHNQGLAGHSDADAVLHAITDALLGAAALGDIGQHFSDQDEAHKNCDSRVFLRHTKQLLTEQGYQIANLDVTIITEAPKISPHKASMCDNIADDLGLAVSQINIKATTNEKMGFIGRGEGIAVMAIALLA